MGKVGPVAAIPVVRHSALLRRAILANFDPSNLPTIVGPMQQGLFLTGATKGIAGFTIHSNLRNMSPEGLPSLDLAFVFFRHSAAEVITAIPLEPAARIVLVYPSLTAPFRQGLAGIDAKIVEGTILSRWRKFGLLEPGPGKFLLGIRHVLAAKHPELQHLLGRQFWLEIGSEFSAHWRRQLVTISLLHAVIHNHLFFS